VRFVSQDIEGPLRVAAAVVAAALVGVAASGTAEARILKRLDYESGNFSQWGAKQAVRGGAKVIRSPRRQGRYAARFVVRSGDDPIGATGERAEVWSLTRERAGKSSWWKWSTRFPKNFRVGRHWWNIFTQWHH
jgi:polysaccharide lyase-like protein